MMDCRLQAGRRTGITLAAIALGMAMITGTWTGAAHAREPVRAGTLPDLSGLAWVEDDLFIGIHDAKRSPEKADWPRVSLLRLPRSELEGVTWQPLDLRFPGPGGPGSDLESAGRIPGGKSFLFAESGQEGEGDRRIFHAVYENGTLAIRDHAAWPAAVENVEAIAVCRAGRQLVFLYAERADGRPETRVRWAPLSLDPITFGEFQEAAYAGVDPVGGGARPIVAMDVDAEGLIYIVSAYDSGNDDGPFRSVVWRIGRVAADAEGNPRVDLNENKRLATLDGLKVESIAVIETPSGEKRIYVGTDDEHYGGILRPLPVQN